MGPQRDTRSPANRMQHVGGKALEKSPPTGRLKRTENSLSESTFAGNNSKFKTSESHFSLEDRIVIPSRHVSTEMLSLRTSGV